MTTPASDQNESSKMKKLISGNVDESIHSKLPPRNGADRPRTPASTPRSSRCLPPRAKTQKMALQIPASFLDDREHLSLTVNLILIILLLLAFQMLSSFRDFKPMEWAAPVCLAGCTQTLSKWIRQVFVPHPCGERNPCSV